MEEEDGWVMLRSMQLSIEKLQSLRMDADFIIVRRLFAKPQENS